MNPSNPRGRRCIVPDYPPRHHFDIAPPPEEEEASEPIPTIRRRSEPGDSIVQVFLECTPPAAPATPRISPYRSGRPLSALSLFKARRHPPRLLGLRTHDSATPLRALYCPDLRCGFAVPALGRH